MECALQKHLFLIQLGLKDFSQNYLIVSMNYYYYLLSNTEKQRISSRSHGGLISFKNFQIFIEYFKYFNLLFQISIKSEVSTNCYASLLITNQGFILRFQHLLDFSNQNQSSVTHFTVFLFINGLIWEGFKNKLIIFMELSMEAKSFFVFSSCFGPFRTFWRGLILFS